MFGHEISVLSFWLVALMICVILLIIVAQISHISSKTQRFMKHLEEQNLALSAQLKQLQGTLSELLGETRRGNRLTNEMVELKQAEMTGDFEIVEEPLAAPPPASKTVAAAAEPKLSEPPRSFPKI